MTEVKRIEVKCPFCQKVEEVSATDASFEHEREKLKKLIGQHIYIDHPDRIYEMAVVFAGPLQEFIRARMDGTRREGRSLTDLQKAAAPLNLGRS